jgi:hypothetical protein
MLQHSIKHLRDANASFSQYHNVALQQYIAMQQILRTLFPENADELQGLDFACGYGRLLRLLTHSLSVNNITASEIQPEALAFVIDRFGVRVAPSNADPKAFQPRGDIRLHLGRLAVLASTAETVWAIARTPGPVSEAAGHTLLQHP